MGKQDKGEGLGLQENCKQTYTEKKKLLIVRAELDFPLEKWQPWQSPPILALVQGLELVCLDVSCAKEQNQQLLDQR